MLEIEFEAQLAPLMQPSNNHHHHSPIAKIPLPSCSSPQTLYVKWTGYGDPLPKTYENDRGTHCYRLAVQATEPIRVGRRVKLLALTPIIHYAHDVPPNEYDTHDVHVVGRVLEIGERKEGRRPGTTAGMITSTARIQNECRGNMVETVQLEIVEDNGECGEPSRRDRRSRKRKRDPEEGSGGNQQRGARRGNQGSRGSRGPRNSCHASAKSSPTNERSISAHSR